MMNYKYTNQEAFDIAVRGVLGQGRASVDQEGYGCLYRGPNGLKCAAGWIVPDELYQPEFDTSVNPMWDHIVRGRPDLQALADVGLVLDLQKAHDKHAEDDRWLQLTKKLFRDVAVDYGLSDAAVDEF